MERTLDRIVQLTSDFAWESLEASVVDEGSISAHLAVPMRQEIHLKAELTAASIQM